MFNFLYSRSTVTLLFLLALSACRPTTSDTKNIEGVTASENLVSVMTDHVNYSHERGMSYTLFDLSRNPPQAIGGAIVDRLGSGGEKGCCLALPVVWKSGMKVRVQWTESDLKQTYPEEHVRELEIPKYERHGDLFIVFYPGHEVEVVVSAAEPGHPSWQGRVQQTPWEMCVKNYGQKICKSATPDPIMAGLKESCKHVPYEPNCQAYFAFCRQQPDNGDCP